MNFQALTSLLIFVLQFCFLLPLYAQHWVPVGKIAPQDRRQDNEFGFSSSMYGDYLLIGEFNHCQPSSPFWIYDGAVYAYQLDSVGNFQETQLITASGTQENRNFGVSVDMYDTWAVVGAYKDNFDENEQAFQTFSGSAFFLKRDASGQWIEQQKVAAPDRNENAFFGNSVAIYDSTAFIGAPGNDTNITGADTLDRMGAVYVYELAPTGIWALTQKIIASDPLVYAELGNAVHIHENYGIIGASRKEVNMNGQSTPYAGSAYFFEKDTAGQWIEKQIFNSPNPDEFSNYGVDVKISSSHILIGEQRADYDNGQQILPNTGSVYVFDRDTAGTWNPFQLLVPPDARAGEIFGYSIDVFQDKIAVGAPDYWNPATDTFPPNLAGGAGIAYTFEKDSLSGQFVETGILRSSRPGPGFFFGYTVSIFDQKLCVGSKGEILGLPGQNTVQNAGAAFIFYEDLIPPVAEITSSENGLTHLNPFPVQITFNEDVYGFDSADVHISRGILSQLNGGPRVYSAMISPEPGPLTIQIPAGIATDLATNPNTASNVFSITYTFPLGIAQWADSSQIEIFPNPVSDDWLQIRISGTAPTKMDFRLTDMRGRILKQGALANDKSFIDMTKLPSGLYFLHLDAGGDTHVTKIVREPNR